MRIEAEQVDSLAKLFKDCKEDSGNIDVEDVVSIDNTILVNIGVDRYKIEPDGTTYELGWDKVDFDES